MKCLYVSIMVMMPCAVSAAEFSVTQRNGKYCFQRPDGRVVMLLGMSHASAGPPVVGLETTIKDLRDCKFNAVGYAKGLVDEFLFIHNADKLVGSPKVERKGHGEGQELLVRGRVRSGSQR